jgi:NAD(P)-dependent dehydrogenase (short-subunit alcohol dehydrogenase family)
MEEAMPTALITGASSGLGKALAFALARRRWSLVIDARTPERLHLVANDLAQLTEVRAVSGDVTDRSHRGDLVRAVTGFGSLDLLVNNASSLGPSPLPDLCSFDLDELSQILDTNVVAPLGLIQQLLPRLSEHAVIINISSDAAVAAYPGWGGYGASKAAVDHLTATLAAEQPTLKWYSIDPGDMRTPMHQAAFPGEDISDRPEPESVVPALITLLDTLPASGRYRLADLGAANIPSGTGSSDDASGPAQTTQALT